MPRAVFPQTREGVPPESVLRQLRIPFVRRAALIRGGAAGEDVFVIDLGLAGVFVERPEALPVGEKLEIRLPLPDNEIPLQARCRVAWWHPEGGALASKSLPAGAGLEFVEMSETDRGRLREQLVEYCRQHPRVRRFLRHWPQAEKTGDDP
jgi:two-component system, cell cycle response regulator